MASLHENRTVLDVGGRAGPPFFFFARVPRGARLFLSFMVLESKTQIYNVECRGPEVRWSLKLLRGSKKSEPLRTSGSCLRMMLLSALRSCSEDGIGLCVGRP